MAEAKINYGMVYLDIHKDTNLSWMMNLPKIEYSIENNGILHELDLGLLFTMARGSTIPNHYGVVGSYNVGFDYNGWFTTMGIDVTQVFEGNDYGIAPGLYFGNTFRIGRQIFN